MISKAMDLIVLDGRVSWLISKIFFKLRQFPEVALISCTSFAAPVNVSSAEYFDITKYKKFLMSSWLKVDLDEAYKQNAIKIRAETLDEIYCYAGGSVRNAQLEVPLVINLISAKIKKCPDIDFLIGSGVVSEASSITLNFMKTDCLSVVPEEYFLRILLGKDGLQKLKCFV